MPIVQEATWIKMAGEKKEGSKRRRVDDQNSGTNENVVEDEEVVQLRLENKQLRELVEELKGVVECQVCWVLPRDPGPVPVCSNGHFVCRTCRQGSLFKPQTNKQLIS